MRPVPHGRRWAALVLTVATVGAAFVAPAVASAAATKKPKPSSLAVCRKVQARADALKLEGGRRSLAMLATGDSMVFPVHAELSTILRSRGVKVTADRRDGTGLTTTDTVVWRTLAKQQVKKVRPAVTVITLGGRDGGLPLKSAHGKQVNCCGPAWMALYAGKVRSLVRTYLQDGRGKLYWLLLPAPREAARVPLYAAINDTLRMVAAEFPGQLRLIPVDDALSPNYAFANTVSYDGLTLHPRTADGIHLNHEGACVEVDLVIDAMVADGLLGGPTPVPPALRFAAR